MTPYYSDTAVTLYHGDSEALMPQLRAEAVITDPPYGVGVKYGPGYDDLRKDYWEWLTRMVAAMQLVAPTVIFTHRVKALAHVEGWDWVGSWSKPYASGARVGNSPLLPHWEPIFFFGIHAFGTDSPYVADVFTDAPQKAGNDGGHIGREKWQKGVGSQHPCPKPLSLYQRLTRSFVRPGETVMDPFAGSGTTLVAAKALGRKAIGIEMQERFCDEAARRLSQDNLFTEAA